MTGQVPAVQARDDVPQQRLHLAHVEGLRAIAALVVYVNHAYAHAWHPLHGYAPGVLSVFAYSLLAGHMAVSVFIVISGFVLTLPVVDAGDELRGGAREFFKRRARRILPPYYGALLLSLALIATIIGEPTGSIWDVPVQLDWVAVVSHFLLLQDLYGTGKVNYVFWSIAVEWHLYFLFPLMVLGIQRFGVIRVTLVALVLGYLARFGLAGTRVERANPHFLGLFTLGILAAYVVRSQKPLFERWRSAPWGLISGATFGLVVGLCALWGYETPALHFPYLDLPVGLMTLALLVHTTLRRSSSMHRFLSFKLVAFVGTFSYSIYLLHAPILQVLWQYVLVPLQPSAETTFLALMTGGGLVTLGLSYAFFKVCEEPFMRKRRVIESPKQIGTAPVAP